MHVALRISQWLYLAVPDCTCTWLYNVHDMVYLGLFQITIELVLYVGLEGWIGYL